MTRATAPSFQEDDDEDDALDGQLGPGPCPGHFVGLRPRVPREVLFLACALALRPPRATRQGRPLSSARRALLQGSGRATHTNHDGRFRPFQLPEAEPTQTSNVLKKQNELWRCSSSGEIQRSPGPTKNTQDEEPVLGKSMGLPRAPYLTSWHVSLKKKPNIQQELRRIVAAASGTAAFAAADELAKLRRESPDLRARTSREGGRGKEDGGGRRWEAGVRNEE